NKDYRGSVMMVTLVIFGSLVLFLILGIPIGVSLGLASLCAILYSGIIDINYLAQTLITSTDSFPLMAIPFFVLAGDLMGKGGISKRLLKVADAIFGRFTGSLAFITVAGCIFFAAISGSGPATVAAIGGLMVPAMIESGYNKRFSAAVSASSGSIGVIIPPSIPMVMYGISTGVSITMLFMAGMIPGIIIGVLLMLYSYYYCKKHGYKSTTSSSFSIKNLLSAVNEAKWSLIMPLIILGGIYGGVFTPTEAGAVAVIYGYIIGRFVYKELKLKDVPDILKNSALTTATVLIIVGTATSFGRILTIEQVPLTIANFIQSLTSSPAIILLLINILLLIVGTFMDTTAAIIILAPILFPIATSVGIDPVHFGIVMVVNLSIGFITPPLGVNLFVACGISKLSLEEMSKGIIPFFLVMVLALTIITYIPSVSLWLPRLFF
ncbi:TRAP transporter large permease, partial [Tepidanaerobacter sp. GT38]|uniref:TRAP transporter large permease n=1 Tax=Tepidanaerobacter sp. GT38 TaxID=2722793 RepID=UPI001F389C47